jgi:type IV secretory pathway TraG/TraD family ATPase VirD4
MFAKRTKPAKHVFDDIYDLPEFWTDDRHYKHAKAAIWFYARMLYFALVFAIFIAVFYFAPASAKTHLKPYSDVFGIIDTIESICSAAVRLPSLLIIAAASSLAVLIVIALFVRLVMMPWAKRRFQNLTGGFFDLAGSGRVSDDPERLREIGYFDDQGPYVGLVPDGKDEQRYCRAPHNVHVLLIAPTGGGKTSAYIIPLLLSAEL